MATPKDFDGKFTIKKSNGLNFLPEDESDIFTVWFFRREKETKSLKEFLNALDPENMGYDKPSNQLFYRSLSSKLYRIDFTEVK
jgi:hypothetical protein